MPRHIVLAIKDAAAVRTGTLAKAVQLAGRGGRLDLFYAVDASVYGTLAAYPELATGELERERISAQALLHSIAKPLRDSGVQVQAIAAIDYPCFEAIVRHSTHAHADLVIVDCENSHTLPARLLGSTDWSLLRRCPLPVLLVKSQALYDRPVVLAAVEDPAGAILSRLDEAVLREARGVVAHLHGTLHVVHAQARLALHGALPARSPAPLPGRLDIAAEHVHVARGRPARVILDTARVTQSQIVVLGVQAHPYARRIVGGATAERILDSLGCDVLVLKPPQFRAAVRSSERSAFFYRSRAS